jgi:3'-phosphoadenosine 5'-phosphosulfate (PAPS) 3'-phosphatase
MKEIDGALDFAITLAHQAGVIQKENFVLGMRKEWKEDNTPLTATDKKINALVLGVSNPLDNLRGGKLTR